MTVEVFVEILRCHLAALRSSAWPRPGNSSTGPALYLDEADTQAAITELTRLHDELAEARAMIQTQKTSLRK
jgi:hypothetical protein